MRGAACRALYRDHTALFQTAPGSSANHQAWPGGYHDHVVETMNVGLVLHDALSACRPLPFTRSDVLLVLFLHDVEKPWKYEIREGVLQPIADLASKSAQRAFRAEKLAEYGIRLTTEQANALRYVECEGADYSRERRVMQPLAALCHMADVASARLWPEHPLAHDDPWIGAHRVRT